MFGKCRECVEEGQIATTEYVDGLRTTEGCY